MWDELEVDVAEPRAPAYVGAVTIRGQDVDLDRVLASVSIRHGRDDVDGGAQSSTATLRLRRQARSELDAWIVGGELRILDLELEPLFSGTVSDLGVAADDPHADALVSVIAVSTLASAGSREVGGHVWPAEAWASRVSRILTEAGYVAGDDFLVQAPAVDVPIAETKPADPETGAYAASNALDALELARQDVGASIFDDELGRIVVQALDARRDLYPRLEPDPATILYAPAWAMTLDVANRIVLGYGYGAGTVTVDDPASQAIYDVHWTGLFDTGLADEETALDRARVWLDRVSSPRWKLPGLTLLEPLPLHVGQMLELSELPASAPLGAWNPIVEGWTDVIEGPDWTQELVLSDPMLSGLALAWEELPAELLWELVDPKATWSRSDSLENLLPIGAADA